MKLNSPKTDRNLSFSAIEYVWDGVGPTSANQYLLPIVDRILSRSKSLKVLDLGCGNGYATNALAKLGYEISGCDFSQSGIELAKLHHPGVEFFQHDVSLPLPSEYLAKYDAVISMEVIEHLLLPRKLIESALSALRPGGLLVVSTPYHGYFKNLALAVTDGFDRHWHPLRDYGHIKFFSRKTLSELFSEYDLQDIHFDSVGRIPLFGKSMVVSGVRK